MNGILYSILTTHPSVSVDSDGLNWSRLRSAPSFVIKGDHEFPSVFKRCCSSGLARARLAALNLSDRVATPDAEYPCP